MKKQPRLFPAFVAFSLLLASGPLPAAARMNMQAGTGSGARVPVVPVIGSGIHAGSFANALTPGVGLNGPLGALNAVPEPLAPSALAIITQQAAATRSAELNPTLSASIVGPMQAPSGTADASSGWSDGSRRFDGGSKNSRNGAAFVDSNSRQYRQPSDSEQRKLKVALRYGAEGSLLFEQLNREFGKQGGYYLLDSNQNARYMAAAAVDQNRRPVIVLTHDLLNRYNGRREDVYRGAPWEFIASVLAREQVFHAGWYDVIPASAEKLAVSYMSMVRAFVDLTNGTSRSWATDKDYQAVAGDRSTYMQWNWFEQLVAAARAAASGVGTNTGHLIDSKFFSWVRDWTAPQDKASVPAFQYSLWEQFQGTHYRPGNDKNGLPLPPDAPRIDKYIYDRAAYAAYGTDGKGSAHDGGLDQSGQVTYSWIIRWLKDRLEIR